MKQLLFCLLMFASSVNAAIEAYEFDTPTQRERFQTLSEELRCPKCQNQNLADSNSPIAKDLREQLYRMIGEGQSDAQVKEFMVARYGDFVLYKPEVNAVTYLLWYGPYALLILGFVVVIAIAWKRKRPEEQVEPSQQTSEAILTQAQHKRDIAALLDTKDD
ncbi:MAG: cytochrome c-type biogenesis protein [Pseudomonadales bacterium]